jgi:plasmid stabilization system protein ParE
MSYQVKVDPSATAELDEAMDWFEGQKAGLGVDFLLKFYNAVAFLKENPKLYPQVHQSFRRVLMKKYPYAIYYAIAEANKEVVVLAVWHTSQDPDKLRERLR